jgi:hypothetical protein
MDDSKPLINLNGLVISGECFPVTPTPSTTPYQYCYVSARTESFGTFQCPNGGVIYQDVYGKLLLSAAIDGQIVSSHPQLDFIISNGVDYQTISILDGQEFTEFVYPKINFFYTETECVTETLPDWSVFTPPVTRCPLETQTPTPTPTRTPAPSCDVNLFIVPSPTPTTTTTSTPTKTPTQTPTQTPTNTRTPTPTSTLTSTPTQTATNTGTPTQTPTTTPTPTTVYNHYRLEFVTPDGACGCSSGCFADIRTTDSFFGNAWFCITYNGVPGYKGKFFSTLTPSAGRPIVVKSGLGSVSCSALSC